MLLLLLPFCAAPGFGHLVKTVTVRAAISTSSLEAAVRLGAFDSTLLVPGSNLNGDSILQLSELEANRDSIAHAIATRLQIRDNGKIVWPDAVAIGVATLMPGTSDPLELSCLMHYAPPAGKQFGQVTIDPNIFRDNSTSSTSAANGHPVVLNVDACGRHQIIPSFGAETYTAVITPGCPGAPAVSAPGIPWNFSEKSGLGDHASSRPGTGSEMVQEQNDGGSATQASSGSGANGTSNGPAATSTGFSPFKITWFFLVQGVMHILTGWDHIFFVIGLVLVAGSFRNLVRVISAFTVSHSLTLLITAGNIITINKPEMVEAGIALSIAYIGLENIVKKGHPGNSRWIVAFLFGLIHGCGFAGALKEDIGQYTPGSIGLVVLCLLLFNVGVEIGQLLIIGIIYPILLKLRVRRPGTVRMIAMAGSVVVFVMGVSWFLDRTILPGKIWWAF